jgi:hypothetical protein
VNFNFGSPTPAPAASATPKKGRLSEAFANVMAQKLGKVAARRSKVDRPLRRAMLTSCAMPPFLIVLGRTIASRDENLTGRCNPSLLFPFRAAPPVIPPKPDRYFNDTPMSFRLKRPFGSTHNLSSSSGNVRPNRRCSVPKDAGDSSVEDYAQRRASLGVGQKTSATALSFSFLWLTTKCRSGRLRP